MTNLEIAKLLKNVAAAYIIKDENKFRFQIIAYQKASETVSNLTFELIDYYKDNKLDELPGIGKTIKSHLIELFKTGKVSQFEWILKNIPESVFVLMDIPTFGPKKSFKLTSKFKLFDPKTVIDELEKLAINNKIASIEGFGEKSQSDIIRAINEFKLGKGKVTRILLPTAIEISDKIIDYLKKIPEVVEANALGSLRRKSATVGDIDIAVASSNPNRVIKHFTNYPYIERIIEKGDVSSSILISGGKQIDLLVQPINHYGTLLQHFTGSKNHNIHLREIALKKGLSLSEYGVKDLKSGQIRPCSTGKELYKAIGLEWIPPELREDTGEIELAQKNSLPNLIELKDLKGDLHIHSNYPIEPSHDLGDSSMEEILARAKELNYEYLAFSEHNPSQSKHSNYQIYEILSRRSEYIEHIKSSTKDVRIFKFLEIDILPNGSLAIDNKAFDLLDGAIVSIHSVFSMNKIEMTKRIINGLSHPKAKILAHPTGKMINVRPGYDLEWDKIFEFCNKYNKALEINSWPTRLDLNDSLIRFAIKYEVKLIIDSDSHNVKHMDNQKYGIYTAKRGWATKNDILNSLSYNEFNKWLKI